MGHDAFAGTEGEHTGRTLPGGDALLRDLLGRINDRTAKVVVVGQGYVGLPVAMRLADVGFSTVGFETDPTRCESLTDGTSYVEDVSDEDLQQALISGYEPTNTPDRLTNFDIAVITVPTPLKDAAPDLSFVSAAAETLARYLRPGALVILESTTYPGTTERILKPALEQSELRCGRDFFLGYSPERIDPGNRTWNFVNTPKVVSGTDRRSHEATAAFYRTAVDRVVEVEGTATAEMVKILENTYRHVNIALVNELAMFARELDVDIWDTIDAASTKPFGFTPFRPGPGVGGHCLPIDPSYLSWRVRQDLGQSFRFVELANDVNEQMPRFVVNRIGSMLNQHRRSINGTSMLLLGMTYKAGTSDWRQSPSLTVADQLTQLGAKVTLCDPHIQEPDAIGLDAPFEPFGPTALADADLTVVLVDHPEFDPTVVAEHAKLIFDAKALLRGEEFNGETL